jgi:hypothetical protein
MQLATRRVRYELRKEGNDWEKIDACIDAGIYLDKIRTLAKSMITKNKAPTKLLTDDKHWLDKIQHLVKNDTDSEFENMYNQL